jgi:thioredoxin-like negative regulator of GroEL
LSGRYLGKKAKVHDRDPVLPTLVFFFSETSGPARRMESLLAHIERKERGRLRMRHVDAAEHPRLVKKFGVTKIPTLVLVVDQRAVAKREGRASMPQIEELLEQHLPREFAAA